MVCLFHGDYGPADPAFKLGSGSAWVVDLASLEDARNIGEAEAIHRQLLRGEPVSWCDQGYAWVRQDAVGWFYVAAFLLVVLPYLIARMRAWAKAWRPEMPPKARRALRSAARVPDRTL
jgi:hypothetical protein